MILGAICFVVMLAGFQKDQSGSELDSNKQIRRHVHPEVVIPVNLQTLFMDALEAGITTEDAVNQMRLNIKNGKVTPEQINKLWSGRLARALQDEADTKDQAPERTASGDDIIRHTFTKKHLGIKVHKEQESNDAVVTRVEDEELTAIEEGDILLTVAGEDVGPLNLKQIFALLKQQEPPFEASFRRPAVRKATASGDEIIKHTFTKKHLGIKIHKEQESNDAVVTKVEDEELTAIEVPLHHPSPTPLHTPHHTPHHTNLTPPPPPLHHHHPPASGRGYFVDGGGRGGGPA
jgi:hypothetical protein